MKKRSDYASELSGKPKLVFSGGSSTAFQVDVGALTTKDGLPSVNLGLHAGMGFVPIVSVASDFLKKGDTLVLMMESNLVSGKKSELYPDLGKKGLLVMGIEQPAFMSSLFKENYNPLSLALACRPGMYNVSTMTLKVLMGRKPYRYTEEDVHDGGYMTTAERTSPGPLGFTEYHLSDDAKHFFGELKQWAAGKGVRIVYLMPISFVDPKAAPAQAKANEAFLKEIGEYFPVIHDPSMGISSEASDFADTTQHMTGEAASRRTKQVAELLHGYFDKNPAR